MADVIEDLEIILRRTINYLTRVLYGLCRRLSENSHRPFNRRTFVRWLAAFMPGPKEPRLRLQTDLATAGYPALDRWASCGSLASAFSSVSINQLVEEDLGDNVIRYRRGCGDIDLRAEMFDEPSFLPHSKVPDFLTLTSTPKFFSASSYDSVTSSNPAANEKLLEMEEELAALRQQIAMLVMAQEPSVFCKTATEVETELMTTSHAAAIPLPVSPGLSTQDDSGCESEVVARRPDLPLISENCTERACRFPAPPPLPLMFNRRSSSESKPLSEQLQQRKRSLLSLGGPTTARRKTLRERDDVPDMATILKDLGNVKLRAVERSPGGTPMRRHPEREPTDPSAIIAQALKKKFSNHWAMSSESDKENDSSSFASDHSFGRHKTMKAKKKLNMQNESSDNWTPVASPLKA